MRGFNAFVRLAAAGLSLPALLLAAGCARQESTEAAAAPVMAAPLPGGLKPAASVLDLMLDPVDSNADALWEAVAVVSTASGIEEHKPRSDAEWLELRRRALLLQEASNLLVVEGRPVAHPGQQLEEASPDSTDYTPEQAQAEIDKDRGSFVGFAVALQSAAGQIVGAIDKRDVDAYLEAGGALDEACENCHRRFWYPNSPIPPGA